MIEKLKFVCNRKKPKSKGRSRTFVFRGLPLSSDSRTLRNGSFFSEPIYCTWEKKNASKCGAENIITFPLPKDGGGMIFKYPLYIIYLFWFSLTKIRSVDVCLCMDLDTFVPIWIGSCFKKTKIVFDVVDPASQARFRKLPFSRLIDKIESFFIYRATFSIFPSESRISYYPSINKNPKALSKCLVIENIPKMNYGHVVKRRKRDGRLTIGYFGTLDSTRGLGLILDLAERNPQKLRLLIAGDGPLKQNVEKHCNRFSNIEYVGRYTVNDIAHLYSRIDFSWMYYDPSVKLHRYAAPNKFYEHLYFQIPVLTNEVIPQSAFIRKNKTGVVIDSDDTVFLVNGCLSTSLIDYLNSFVAGAVLYTYWDQNYSDYYLEASRQFRSLVGLDVPS